MTSKWPHRPEWLAVYRGTGLELIPLHVPDALDRKGRPVGKAPLNTGWRRQPHLTVDEAQAHMRDGGNVGVRLRDEDLVVDVDPKNFLEGDNSFERLKADLGYDFSDCPLVVTGSGGFHFYLRKPKDFATRQSLEAYPGIEFKTLGTQVVAAGSVHPNGNVYRMDELSPAMADRPLAQQGLLELIRRPGRLAAVDAGERTPEELASMLEGLDATDFRDYSRFLTIMMACHHATAGEGREEFLEWAATDPEYHEARAENGRKWDGLHADSGGRRVTEKTLFKFLKDGGRVDLLPRTAAEDDFDEVSEEDLRVVDEGGDVVLGDEGDPAFGPLEAFNAKGYCAVDDNGQFRVYRNIEDRSFKGEPRMVWRTYRKGDFLDVHSNIRAQKNDKTVNVAQEWLYWGQRTSYNGVAFDPAGRIPKSARILNLWTDWAVQPRHGDWSLLKRLIREALCAGDGRAYEYVLDWMAFMIQRPDEQAEVALVFRGAKGTGKGTLGKALAKLAGRHGLHISSQHHFTNHFNAHLRDCIFLFADEAIWAGDKKAEGELKRLITEPTLLFEAKGKDAVTGLNMLHVMMASNEDWVVPASLDDERRFAVFDVDPMFRGNRAFFDALYEQLDGGGLEAMLFELKTRNIGTYHPRAHIPVTSALARQKLNSLDYVDSWWYECLCRGSLVGDFQPIEGAWEGPLGSVSKFATQDLQDSLSEYLRSMGDRHRARRSMDTLLGDRLKKRVPTILKRRITVPKDRLDVKVATDGRTYGYLVPCVRECRDMFEEQIGSKLDWEPELDGEEELVPNDEGADRAADPLWDPLEN